MYIVQYKLSHGKWVNCATTFNTKEDAQRLIDNSTHESSIGWQHRILVCTVLNVYCPSCVTNSGIDLT